MTLYELNGDEIIVLSPVVQHQTVRLQYKMNIITLIIIIITIIIITRPWPAFGRQGLVGSSGGYTYHGYTSHASPRACGARLGRKMSRNGRNVISPIYRHF